MNMPDKPSIFAKLFAWAGGYIGCATILSTILGGVVGFGFGLLYATGQAYQQQYLAEKERIEPILASDLIFRDVTCHRRSNGGVYLNGVVATQADRDRLREQIVRVVGEKRADEIVLAVMVFREGKP